MKNKSALYALSYIQECDNPYLPKVRFFVMNETDRTSGAVIEKLDANNIAHCYMDEFAQDAIQPYKNIVLRQNLQLIL